MDYINRYIESCLNAARTDDPWSDLSEEERHDLERRGYNCIQIAEALVTEESVVEDCAVNLMTLGSERVREAREFLDNGNDPSEVGDDVWDCIMGVLESHLEREVFSVFFDVEARPPET